MPMLPRTATSPGEPPPFVLTSTDLCRWYFPVQGLGCSLFVHGIALVLLILLFPVVHRLAPKEHPLERSAKDNAGESRMVIYLPSSGGGKSGGGGLKSSSGQPRAAPGPGSDGMVYPGPLPIRSDSSEPTSSFQTLLQPDLADPPVLRRPWALPNMVSLPEAALTAPFRPPKKPERERPEASDLAANDLAHLKVGNLPIRRRPLDIPNLPPPPDVAAAPQSESDETPIGLADLDNPEQQQPTLPSVGGARQPLRVELEDLPIARRPLNLPNLLPRAALAPSPDPSVGQLRVATNLLNVVSLSPLPTSGDLPVKIPVGEARGRFAISPDADPDPSKTAPGSLSALPSEDQTAGSIGDNADAAESPSIVTITFGQPGGSGGEGASGGGSGDGGTGSGAGSGAGTGVGSGSGSGSGPGEAPIARITTIGGFGGDPTSKSGTGSDSDAGSVPKITTVGGFGGTESNPAPDTPPARPLRKRYELFVLSTEKGGGGLPYFGVFSDEQIRTVYLDMRQSETEAAPLWIIEFGVPRDTAILPDAARELDETQQGFVLPFPAVKEHPAPPPELVRPHLGKMVIVFAVIDAEGKMEQMSVKDSPDPLLNQPLLDALRKWVFRPGVLDGHPVPVKALVGIPLWQP